MSSTPPDIERDRTVPPHLLDGKVGLVTGAAGGIGVATALALARAGARVVVTDLPQMSVGRVADDLAAQGLDVAACDADLTDEADVEALVAFTVERYGGLDVVDNNAAASLMSAGDFDVTSMDVELWDQTMAANLRSQMLVCKHALPVMIERGGGSVVNISSGLGLTGDFTRVAYSCSKAAIVALTRHVATAYGGHGVRCNAIAPGVVGTTAAQTQMPESMLGVFAEHSPMGRLGRPEDIANAVLFLASDLAGYVNGQIICVDGGLIAHSPTAMPIRDLVAQMT
jgi:NAD(P)-dependent dehydrogenase (short-subunit alcohol dehydrogenase family)